LNLSILKKSLSGQYLLILLVIISLILAYFSTFQFVAAQGIDYFDGNQYIRHKNLMEGVAGNPWQYRILTVPINQIAIKIGYKLGLPYHIAYAFIFVRLIIDAAIYFLAFFYYRKLGVYKNLAIIGILLLAWGISYSWFDSDISTNTFLEVVFYLLAGLAILYKKWFWIPIIVFFAALNRETSVLIPFIFISAVWLAFPKELRREGLMIFWISLAIFIIFFFGLRILYGKQELIIPHGISPGMGLLLFNIGRWITWDRLLLTLSLIPFVALFGYQKWPITLRCFFWVLVPTWFFVHAFVSVMAETRLFIVPLALVFIPGALFFASPLKTSTPTE
jgi:hypothetical protein